eukprot:Seg15340.1 transcript_id=Seg15340.1/GoldUCD/mRNA.D3Y31 product="Arylsulfatase I" protein_id=Seg15340.1/GoldUCD/D3Y31
MKNLLLSLIASAVAQVGVQAAEKPNVIIFLVDDMGLMDTSVPFVVDENGKPVKQKLNGLYRTPGMEALAKDGVRFSHFYANSVCSPSRSSLLNGQFSARHKTTQWINPKKQNAGPEGWNWAGLKPDDVSLQSILKKAGYNTAHLGKAHLGPFKHVGSDPQKVGFDINVGGTAIGQPGSYLGEKDYGKGKLHAVPHLEKYHGTDTFLTEALTLEAKEVLTKFSKQDEPFFMHMSHYAAHTPFEMDKRFVENYASIGSKKTKAFAGLIEGMDKSLGDLVAHLKKIGEAENTLIIFLGDNGSDAPLGGVHDIASSAPYRGKKGTHYQGGMLAPLLIAWAQPNPNAEIQKKFPIKQGIVSEDFVTVCDLMPTVLKITGTSAPENHKVDGHELTSYLAIHKGTHSQKFLMHFPHTHRSSNFTVFIDGNWKVIKHYGKSKFGKVELFNLKEDPTESNNLAEKNAEQLKVMLTKMQKSLDDCGAQYFKK